MSFKFIYRFNLNHVCLTQIKLFILFVIFCKEKVAMLQKRTERPWWQLKNNNCFFLFKATFITKYKETMDTSYSKFIISPPPFISWSTECTLREKIKYVYYFWLRKIHCRNISVILQYPRGSSCSITPTRYKYT